jgi:hypothetical protein
VILSSVRKNEPGFLRSQPRMNVALTRCRKGMVVVTDKYFLQGAGKSMLLGQLCHTWSRRHDTCWIDWNAMLNNSVALPGLPLPSRPPLASSTPQQLPALTRVNEQSRFIPNTGLNSNLRASALAFVPRPLVHNSRSHGSSGGIRSVTTATPRELDDEFPPLPSATLKAR